MEMVFLPPSEVFHFATWPPLVNSVVLLRVFLPHAYGKPSLPGFRHQQPALAGCRDVGYGALSAAAEEAARDQTCLVRSNGDWSGPVEQAF